MSCLPFFMRPSRPQYWRVPSMSNVDFDSMDIGKLRQIASMMSLAVPKTATKADLIEMLKQKRSTMATVVPSSAVDELQPGFARLTIHEDTRQGSKNLPVYINANGYEVLVHRGKEVVVQDRVLSVLKDAVANTYKQIDDDTSPGGVKTVRVKVLSYPYTLHEHKPGPKILTNLEKQKARAHAPRKRYKDIFGYYPRAGQLSRAIEKGVIDMNPGEEISLGEEQFLERRQED